MPEGDKGEEKIIQRYPLIAIVGPVGIGKTTLIELLTESTGITKLQEPYQQNPYLNDFYTKNPADYSFNSQMFFLADDGVQAKSISKLSKDGPVLRDAGGEINLMIANVQWKMGWMTDEQHEAYISSFQKVFCDCLNPDVYIALIAKENTVIERIKKRGREMELMMHEKYPQYFPALVREFNIWLTEKQKESDNKIVVMDTDSSDLTLLNVWKKENAVREVINRSGYFIAAPTQRNMIGSDGAKLIMPSSFRVTPHLVERVVGKNRIY